MRGGARLSVCAVGCLAAGLPAAGVAQSTTWTNHSEGFSHSPANWSYGGPNAIEAIATLGAHPPDAIDGSVDGDDVIEFFERWDSGC
jgi:hypothetical protein